LCDLKNHSGYDVVLERSEASLEAYFLDSSEEFVGQSWLRQLGK
jgi:hypothetical protein